MKDINLVLDDRENARILLTAFQTILNNSSDMIFIKDRNLIYQAATMPFVKMTGNQTLEDIIGRSDFQVFKDQSLAANYVEDDRRILASGKDMIGFNEPLPSENGQMRYATTTKFILRDHEGNVVGLLGFSRDITEKINAQQHFQRELDRLFDLPENAYAALFIDIRDWQIIGKRTQSVDDIPFPLPTTIEALLANALEHIAPTNAAYSFYRSFSQETLYELYDSGRRSVTMEYPRSMPNGQTHWLQVELTFLRNPFSTHLCAMLTIRDINDEKLARERIIRMAETDEMTGLLNRAATMKQIRTFLAEEGRHGIHALLIIDADNFKQINDTHGHLVGDQCLIHLAKAIQRGFRKSDIVGRIGGDEFFVLMKYVPSRSNVAEKANALLDTINNAAAENPWSVSCSIGISVFRGEDAVPLEQLYDQADQALYRAKNQGKNCIVFFSDPPSV